MTKFTLAKGAAALATAGMLAAPVLSFASTYQYVDYNGYVQSVTANNALTATALATNIAAHSGVMIVEEMVNALPSNMFVPMQ